MGGRGGLKDRTREEWVEGEREQWERMKGKGALRHSSS